MTNLNKYLFALTLAGVLSLVATLPSMGQSIDLIQNGDFNSFTQAPAISQGAGLNSAPQGYTAGAALTGWTNNGYNFVFSGGNAGDYNTITGSGGSLYLWGPANGTANGLSLPTGYTGNIIGADGAYEVGPITQVVSGMTAGQTYQITFDYAGAQQHGYDGVTTEAWSVALGASTGVYTQTSGDGSGTLAGGQTTTALNNVNHGFTGWSSATLDFTATSASETLYFLADGTPSGEPPFSLLADVEMVAVPEPATTTGCMILFALSIMAGNRAWRRFATKSVVTS